MYSEFGLIFIPVMLDLSHYYWEALRGGSVQNFSHILQQPVGKAWFRIELQ